MFCVYWESLDQYIYTPYISAFEGYTVLTDSTRSLLRWLSDIIHVDLSNGQFLTLVHQHQYLLRLSGTVDMHTKQSPITRLERSFAGSRTTKQTLRQPSSILSKKTVCIIYYLLDTGNVSPRCHHLGHNSILSLSHIFMQTCPMYKLSKRFTM